MLRRTPLRRRTPLARGGRLRRTRTEAGDQGASSPPRPPRRAPRVRVVSPEQAQRLLARAGLRKKSDHQAELERLDELATKVVILRDGDHCRWGATELATTCWGPLQTHHVWPKGLFPWMRYTLINLIRFCYHHHMNCWHGTNPALPAEWRAIHLVEVDPQLELMARARRPGKTVFEPELIRALLVQERERLERRTA